MERLSGTTFEIHSTRQKTFIQFNSVHNTLTSRQPTLISLNIKVETTSKSQKEKTTTNCAGDNFN